MKSLEQRIVEAASDYKMGVANDGFAEQYGGLAALRNELFKLVIEWEGEVDEESE